VAHRVVVIDNYDSFTYNLVQYLGVLGAECEVVRNDQVTADDVATMAPDGVLLSPGPGGPADAGITPGVIRLLSGRTPILGVCLGHQAIAAQFGAEVTRARAPVHGKASPIVHDGQGPFRGLPSPMLAGRYHSLVVDERTLPPCLLATARSGEGELMGLRHRELPLEGVQFHPESILTEHGLALLDNWLEVL
jgi:anthranilate synthase/aminodeoxychorismate synthase-like glutamine amidotransferase